MFKNILCVFLMSLFLLFPVKTSAPDNSISTGLVYENDELYISASYSGSKPLAVIRYYISYNSDTAKFKKAELANGIRGELKYNKSDGKVILIFLNPSGIKLDKASKLIRLYFNKNSCSDVEISADGAADNGINRLNVELFNSCVYFSNVKQPSSNHSSKSGTSSSPEAEIEDEASSDEASETNQSIMTQINSAQTPNLFIAGFGTAVIFLGALLIAYKLGKSSVKKNGK